MVEVGFFSAVYGLVIWLLLLLHFVCLVAVVCRFARCILNHTKVKLHILLRIMLHSILIAKHFVETYHALVFLVSAFCFFLSSLTKSFWLQICAINTSRNSVCTDHAMKIWYSFFFSSVFLSVFSNLIVSYIHGANHESNFLFSAYGKKANLLLIESQTNTALHEHCTVYTQNNAHSWWIPHKKKKPIIQTFWRACWMNAQHSEWMAHFSVESAGKW